MYNKDEALKKTTEYFNGDSLAADVFLKKYALTDKEGNLLEETPDQMHHRIAKEFARIESKKFKAPMSEEEIFGYLDRFKYIVPAGSPMFGIGNNTQIISLSNCFFLEIPEDSYSSILKVDEQIVNVCKRRGGIGVCADKLRPAGTQTNNAAKTSTGIISFMERYSNSIREVGQSNRRGAGICILSVHHPQIVDFVNVKRDLTKVTGMNISVKLSDEFLKAVENDTEYELRWPVDAREKGQEPKISKMVKAKEIWDNIIDSAWRMGEPGLLLWDNITRETPADAYEEYASAGVNPCAELNLSVLDSCRLVSMNLFSYVDNPFTKDANFDYEKFDKHVQVAERLMDDLVDLESEKIEKILQKIKNDPESMEIKCDELRLWKIIKKHNDEGRRTGLGITAMADAIAAIGLKYGSNKSIDFVESITKQLKLSAYRSSVDMSKELGSFNCYDYKKEENHPFIIRIKEEDEKLYNDMKKYGRRNISLTTIAPTGSISLLTRTSSGVEPLFNVEYDRRRKLSDGDEKVDFTDQNGDKWQEYKVYHPTYELWKQITGETEFAKSPWFEALANDIDWVQRVKLQGRVQRHICHSISSCLSDIGTYIQTNQGLFELSELSTGSKEKSFSDIELEKLSSINKSNESAEITKSYNNGIAECNIFTLVNGKEITCTPNHLLCTMDENYELVWKTSSKLKNGDYVVSRKGLRLFPEDIRWKSIESLNNKGKMPIITGGNTKNINIPNRMSTDLARFLGYMCSDGCAVVNGINLTQQKNNVCDDFIFLCKKLFNLETRIYEDKRSENLLSITANSRMARNFCKWVGITNHNIIEIPRIIRLSTQQCVKEFIRAATLDGYVSKQHIGVVSSVSKRYVQQMQQMLLNFGINSHIQICSHGGLRIINGHKSQTQIAYVLLLTDSRSCEMFIREIGFAEERKNEEAKNKFKRTNRIKKHGDIPDYGIRKKFRETILPNIKSNTFYTYFSRLVQEDREIFCIDRDTLIEMKDFGMDIQPHLIDDTYEFVKIVDITPTIVKTSDLSVPNGNSYIANSFISHNTINLPNDVSKDTVAQIYQAAWKNGVKGITVYRDGCRSGVLINKKDKDCDCENRVVPKRPKELPCEIYHVNVSKKLDKVRIFQYMVIVGLLDGKPVELFACENGKYDKKVTKGTIIKHARGNYELIFEDGTSIKNITEDTTDSEDSLTRMVSLSLRHNVPIHFIVEQLTKVSGDLFVFAKSISRALKKYIKSGTTSNEDCSQCGTKLIYENGCYICKSCGSSKCA